MKYDWKETANILEFWTAVELLKQDSFEVCTDADAWRNDAEAAKTDFQEEQAEKDPPAAAGRRVRARAFFSLGSRDELLDRIRAEARACGMSVWGNITVFLGRVKRESCILSLAEMLGVRNLKRAEKAADDIAAASFQLTPSGVYVPGTLSFSPLIWALSKIGDRQGKTLSEILRKAEYEKDLRALEEALFGVENEAGNEVQNEAGNGAENGAGRGQAAREISDKESDALSKKDLEEIFGKISAGYLDRYVKKEPGKKAPGRQYYGIRLRFFKDVTARRAYGRVDDSGVSAGCFAEDLELAGDLFSFGAFSETDMGKALAEYIRAPGRGEAATPRIDLLRPENRERFEEFMRDALDARRAPLGKWAAGRPLSLMQQLAVNSAFSAGRTEPPGRIDPVDPASVLQGNRPVFSVSAPPGTGGAEVVKEIIAGNLVEKARVLASYERPDEAFEKVGAGTGSDPGLYSFKDDAIRDHSVLILSARDEAWGDAALSFGKRPDAGVFLDGAAEALTGDPDPEKRAERFAAACSGFRDQLDVAEGLRKELAEYRRCYDELRDRKVNGDPALERYEREAAAEKEDLEKLRARKNVKRYETGALKKELDDKKKAVREKKAALSETAEIRKRHFSDIEKYRKRIDDAKKSTGFFSKLFNNTKYTTAVNAFETSRQELEDAKAEANRLAQALADLEEEKNSACGEVAGTEMKLDAARKDADRLDSEVKEAEARLRSKNAKIEQLRRETDQDTDKLRKFRDAQEGLYGRIPDDDFFSRLLSEDEKEAAEARRFNLWITAEYDRARELLLDRARELIRAFAAGSERCRANLARLKDHLRFGTGPGGQKIDLSRTDFSGSEREEAADALLQTMFLLSPAVAMAPEMVGGLFRDIKRPGTVGTLIVCGAEQMEPQAAVGALLRSRRAVIIGDRKQTGPVLADDLEIIKDAYADESRGGYADKALSVQECVDLISPAGTRQGSGDENGWSGCPLTVHSGSARPMFDMMNRFSYGGMLTQTTPEPEMRARFRFARPKSQWLNVGGRENGGFDHYVKEQGQLACSILDTAFSKDEDPDLFIITPFASVAEGIKRDIKNYHYEVKRSSIGKSENLLDWIGSNVGMIHEFQGRTADEVIFLPGCDDRRTAADAVRSVCGRDVNTVVSRARYRLYVIGDSSVWRKNPFVRAMKNALDMDAFREIFELQRTVSEEKEKTERIGNAARRIPSSTSFIRTDGFDADGEIQYVIDADDFVRELGKADFLKTKLTAAKLKPFGFESRAEFSRLPADVRRCLAAAVRLYELLKPVYAASQGTDASCCGILFCRALELQAAAGLSGELKTRFPEYEIRKNNRRIKLKDAKAEHFSLGTIHRILADHEDELAGDGSAGTSIDPAGALPVSLNGGAESGEDGFIAELGKCVRLRGRCCHPNLFKWADLQELLEAAFGAGARRRGVFFLCASGAARER